MIFKDVCSKPSCTLLFSGENRTCRTTQSCANPLCGRLWNSTRLSGSWNAREERVEGVAGVLCSVRIIMITLPATSNPLTLQEKVWLLWAYCLFGSPPSECPLNVTQNQALGISISRGPLQSDHTFGSWHPISSRVRDSFADTCTRGVNCRLQHISGNANLPSAAEKHASYLCEAVIWI